MRQYISINVKFGLLQYAVHPLCHAEIALIGEGMATGSPKYNIWSKLRFCATQGERRFYEAKVHGSPLPGPSVPYEEMHT